MKEFRRRRLFEALEPRQMLDAASLLSAASENLNALPSVITIADGNSYQYAFEGTYQDTIDSSSVEGLTESFPVGDQVSMTIMKTSTSGAVSSLGEVVIQLFDAEGEAPNSSAHFESLVRDGYYEDLTIHRVISGFVVQGGSSDGYGYEGSGTTIQAEYSDVLTHSGRGMVAFARKGNDPDSSDAQFYITFDSATFLDEVGYNVFGVVVDGYEVIDELESIDVEANPISGEVSFPVESYWFDNVHIVEDEDVNSGTLRLVATDDASGSTSISFTTVDAEGAAEIQQTMVYVGEDGLASYIESALNDISLEFIAGETVEVELPTEFGGHAIEYTISDVTGHCGGYEILSNDPNYATFSIASRESAAQFTTLIVDAKLDNGYSASATKEMYVAPADPTYALFSSGDTKAAALGENAWIVSSDLAESAVEIEVYTYSFDSAVSTDAPINLFVDGSEATYSVVWTEYDEETEELTYRLKLQLDSESALEDGRHVIGVQSYLPIDRVMTHERLYSDVVVNDLFVDTQPLEFAEESLEFALNVGDVSGVWLATNKVDEEGAQRSDVIFSLANPDAGPRFVSLTSQGFFSWADITAEDSGVYYLIVEASDALGNKAELPVTISVAAEPVFDDLDNVNAKTCETYVAKFTASVPGAPDTPIKYTLNDGGFLESLGFELDPSTGAVSWDVDPEYLASGIRRQTVVFEAVATVQIAQPDGTFVDGASTSATFEIFVENKIFDPEASDVPVWIDIQPQTTEPGETFRVTATAEKPADSESVAYSLTGDYPAGMTIQGSTGEIVWDVPEDYFASDPVRSKTLTIHVDAESVWASGFHPEGTENAAYTTEYGDVASTTFELTVVNPEYQDLPPVFGKLDVVAATTGTTYVAAFVATDPNQEADLIAYELIGTGYPEGFTVSTVAATDSARVEWAIPTEYLDVAISSEALRFDVKATEMYLLEDGTYREGLSSEKQYELTVTNARFDEEWTETPVWEKIEAQTTTAGETFSKDVSATVVAQTSSVEYALGKDAPEGMTIDSATGKITWAVPENYFDGSKTVRSKTISVPLDARAILASSDRSTEYGGSASTSFELTVYNPEYIDLPPVFDDLESVATATGSTYEATIVATDPEGEASRVVYELVGEYPSEITLDKLTGAFKWTIANDYLATNVSAQIYSFTVKATEEYLIEGEEYVPGESSEKTFQLFVANSVYDKTTAETPVWEKVDAQNVVAGEALEFDVKATVSDKVKGVEYALDGEYPEGMTIDPATGKVAWDVPRDYFDGSKTIESKTITVALKATTVVDKGEHSVDYGDAANETVEIKITNPDYQSDYSDWREWFDAWVDNAQQRYDGCAANLSEYLTSYLDAVDKRVDKLADAKKDYDAGKSTLTEYLAKREEIQNDFNKEVSDARIERAEADADVEAAYEQQTTALNAAYEELSKREDLKKPAHIKERAKDAAEFVVEKTVEKTTGNASFRMVDNNSGACVATTLTDVLKLWRNGYSKNSVYNDVFSDSSFVETVTEEKQEKQDEQGESGTQTQTDEPSTEAGDDKGAVYTVDEDGNLVLVS